MHDWFTCDGGGKTQRERARGAASALAENETLLPRRLVIGGALSLLGGALFTRSALADVVLHPGGAPSRRTLVVLFLRGGMDGLNAVIPYGDHDYYRHRPTIGVAAPRPGSSSAAVNLDGFFGLHPALASLLPLYEQKQMAIVHGCGSRDQSRSHFEAMAVMERGLPGDTSEASGDASGWLARHLTGTTSKTNSPLRAVAFGNILPDSLRGAVGATAIRSVADYRLQFPDATSPARQENFHQALADLYRTSRHDAVATAGHEILQVTDAIRRQNLADYRPQNGITYPATELGDGLRQVAGLIHADIGLEVACLDRGGWDSHVAEGGAVGILATQLDDVARSLRAFTDDLGESLLRERVTIVVQTEFGRRVYENSGLGTDHGRASVLFAIGAGVHGGQVHVDWKGLKSEYLEGPGDLPVTTDYRDVLAEALQVHGNTQPASVFPGYAPQPVGLFSLPSPA